MQKLDKYRIFHNIKNCSQENWKQQVVSNRRRKKLRSYRQRNADIKGIIWMITLTGYFVAQRSKILNFFFIMWDSCWNIHLFMLWSYMLLTFRQEGQWLLTSIEATTAKMSANLYHLWASLEALLLFETIRSLFSKQKGNAGQLEVQNKPSYILRKE